MVSADVKQQADEVSKTVQSLEKACKTMHITEK